MKLFAATLLAAGPGVAYAQNQAPAPPAQAKPADAPIVVQGQVERKICQTESTTGSIVPRRVCRTQAQIAQDSAQARQTLQTLREDWQAQQYARVLQSKQ